MLTLGRRAAPKLFLLHGWMDVAASFQFLVDAFAREFHVIAPDLRGFGQSAWQPQGYWFADYIADLEALLARFAPGERVGSPATASAANVVMHYAGVRPARVDALISLDGFGIPRGSAGARSRQVRSVARRARGSANVRAVRELRRRRRRGCRRTIRG